MLIVNNSQNKMTRIGSTGGKWVHAKVLNLVAVDNFRKLKEIRNLSLELLATITLFLLPSAVAKLECFQHYSSPWG